MPKSFPKGHPTVKREFNPLKKRIPAVALFLFSIFLLANTIYCYVNAEKFPAGASDLVRTRYDPPVSSKPPELFSIVDFASGSVESKIDCEISLASLEKVGVEWKAVVYLTENNTIFEETGMHILPINKIQDPPSVTINGQTATLSLSNVSGIEWYAIENRFNLTDTTKVATIVVSFNVVRGASNDRFVGIPWVFNGNYAQYIKFPAMNFPVEENKTSDECTFEIDYQLPFRQLVPTMSGWVDEFDLPYTCWTFYPSSSNEVNYTIPAIEYPINQTVSSSGNIYYFDTYFSKQNEADSYMIVTEPNLQVILFIMPFMFSPFYILADYQLKKYEKLGNLKGFFRWVYGFILAYTPIIGFTLLLTGGIVQSLSLLSYLSGIMSPLGFILLAYPFISYAVLDKTILKT